MLAPCYLVHGSEPLQAAEYISTIKQLARKQGYNSFVVFEVNAQFNWEELLNKCQSLDLFADKLFVELRLQNENVGKQGIVALEELLRSQSSDICILINAPKLKTPTLNCPWAKHVYKHGKVQAIKRVANNSSNFSVFDLTEAIINSNVDRTFKTLHGLKDEGVDPVLVLWGLTREVRNLLKLKSDMQTGLSLTQSAQKLGIWRDRLANTKITLDRLSVSTLQQLLRVSANIDTTIKGITTGNAWELLSSVCLTLAGSTTINLEDLNI